MENKYTVDIELRLKSSKAEAEAKKVSKSIKNSLNGEATKGLNKGTKDATSSLDGLKGTMESIRHLSFGSLLVGIKGDMEGFSKSAKRAVKHLTSSFKILKRGFKDDVIDMFATGLSGLIPFTKIGKIIEGGVEGRLFNLTESFKEGFKSIISNLKIFPQNIKPFFKSIKGGFSKIIHSTKLGFAALGAEIIAFIATVRMAVKQTAEIDKLAKSAQKLGMSAQQYGAWTFAMNRSGIETERMVEFVKALAMRQGEVINGSEEAKKAFTKLGYTMDEVANMGQAELFEDVIKRLQGIDDEATRNSIAFKIFGENAIQLTNILNLSNAETKNLMENYRLLGGVMTNELTTGSEHFQDVMTNMRTAMSGVKNAITEALLPAITAVATWLTKIIAKIGIFLRALFGIDIFGGAGGKAKKTEKGFNGVASGIGKATSAAKEFKKWTAGFDELNIIPGPDKGGSGSGSGSIGGGGFGGDLPELKIPNIEDLGLADFEEKVNKYKAVIQTFVPYALIAIGLVGAIACGFAGNVPGLIAFAGMAGLGISIGSMDGGMFDQIAEVIVNWWFDSMLPFWNDHIAFIFTGEWWATKWEQVKQSFSNGIAAIKTRISDGWNNSIVGQWWNNTAKKVFTAEFWSEKWEAISTACSNAWQNLKTAVSDWWNNSIVAWWTENIAPIFTKEYWLTKWNTIKEGCSEKLQEVKDTIDEKWSIVKEWWTTNVAPKFTKEYWLTKWDAIRSACSTKLEAVKTTITDKWSSIKSWFSANVASKFTADYWKTKFNTIKDGAKGAFNGILDIVERAVNRIVGKINTLSWDVPDWVPAIGGKKWGFNFNKISIPRLATGGITTGSTIANIGENGKEAILPLENNTEWIDMLANRLNAGHPTKVILTVDGKELGMAAINNINNITRQTGSLQLSLG